MAKRPRGVSSKGLEIRAKSLSGDTGVVSFNERHPNEEVFYLLALSIGMAHEKGADLFYVTIATPEGLKALAPPTPTVMSTRAMIVVSEFDWRTIEDCIKDILKKCTAPTWSEAAEHLQRYFAWEFDTMHDAARARVIAQTSTDDS